MEVDDCHDDSRVIFHSGSEFGSMKKDESERLLTLYDVERAIFPLIFYENSKNTIGNVSQPSSNEIQGESLFCCSLRRNGEKNHISLPLARRSKKQFDRTASLMLCSCCEKLKRNQEIEIEKSIRFKKEKVLIEIDLVGEEEKRRCEQNQQVIVWNVDESQTIVDRDSGSLTSNEKRILVDRTIRRLEEILTSSSLNRHQQVNEALSTSIEILQRSSDVHQRFIS